MSAATKKLRVTQVKSGIGYKENQKRTLRAMGLEKVGRARILPDNPQVRGMIGSISHLLRVEEVSE